MTDMSAFQAPNDGAPQDPDGAGYGYEDSTAEPGKLDHEELRERVVGWWKDAMSHWHDWRQEASQCFDYQSGHQWAEDDLEILRDQNRPAITFNVVDPFLDAVHGMEVNTRTEITYLPRQVAASGETDLLSEACKWARDECDAEDEESQAFKDAVICGIGCVQTRMDYSEEPDGMPVIERVDPLEIIPDPSARKQNMTDGRFVLRAKDVPLASAKLMFPEADEADLHAQWAEDQADAAESPHNARLAPYYRVDQADQLDREKSMVRLVEAEWWEFVPSYRVLDPTTGRWVRLEEAKLTILDMAARASGIPKYKRIKDQRKKYFKAIFGYSLLKLMDGPEAGGFTYKFITAKRDRNNGTWYGLVRAMMQPQDWANKFFSQSLHIMNTNAKGGLIIESDAVEDTEEFKDSWADADSISIVTPGGIGKIMPKNPPQFPPQLNQMLEYALAAIPKVSGMNIEMMGQSSSNGAQVAAVEAGRRQQGMNILAGLFNAKRRYQKEQGRLMLWMIQTFIADGRLIRIGGPENAQYVPLVHKPGTAEYDVIVDDAPTSPNMKQQCWGAIMQLAPMLRGMNVPPTVLIKTLEFSPLPAAFVQELMKMMQAPPQPNPKDQAEVALKQAQAQETQARVGHIGAEAQKIQAETQFLPQRLQLDTQEQQARIEKMRADATNQLHLAGLNADDQAFQQALDAVNALLDAHKQGADMQMQHIQHAASQANQQQQFAQQAQQQGTQQ